MIQHAMASSVAQFWAGPGREIKAMHALMKQVARLQSFTDATNSTTAPSNAMPSCNSSAQAMKHCGFAAKYPTVRAIWDQYVTETTTLPSMRTLEVGVGAYDVTWHGMM